MENLKPKYNLITAICLVVGIVIGTGVFFKASTVLMEVNGNLTLSIIAWIFGGVIMLITSYNFANISLCYNNIHSMTDFAKYSVNDKFGYIIGVFAKYIYFPSMTSTVSFVVGMYFCEVCKLTSGNFPFNFYVFLFAFIFLTILVATNILAPKIASKIQISTTVIKMIPLILMGLIGLIIGLANNTLPANFNYIDSSLQGNGFLAAICVTSFSYEGWICATNIGGEIKNRNKNLPLALIIGTSIVMLIYIIYNLGLSGAISTDDLLNSVSASESVKQAFKNIFGNGLANILIIIVVISAIGTLNGLVIANSRCGYALAINKQGLFKKQMTSLTKKTNVPLLSSIVGYLLALMWLLYYYYFSQTNDLANGTGFPFDSSELPIITNYLLYIPVLFCFMKKNSNLNVFKRFIMPSLGILASGFMVFAAIYRHKINTVYYLSFFIIVILIAILVKYIQTKSLTKK